MLVQNFKGNNNELDLVISIGFHDIRCRHCFCKMTKPVNEANISLNFGCFKSLHDDDKETLLFKRNAKKDQWYNQSVDQLSEGTFAWEKLASNWRAFKWRIGKSLAGFAHVTHWFF